ncbi:uncharacterized protein MELLADRAFT_66681 [Melampsora larici-populina 98AG31]|uniref:Uncharacterized protein n=1 Tax=Melampsora larici-populina (strain 98AG31 / pathotype 3-4-7) TaxID=747676 RepID=F4S068_MELLP|nr:uncharacterized protein MELLADRAFT_66681 [Melampsora larici-populina 98AG31]EGG01989.1 hypothetical protein MELLADRAFT_66681 [Melampsora larici-populina 98AG31]
MVSGNLLHSTISTPWYGKNTNDKTQSVENLCQAIQTMTKRNLILGMERQWRGIGQTFHKIINLKIIHDNIRWLACKKKQLQCLAAQHARKTQNRQLAPCFIIHFEGLTTT